MRKKIFSMIAAAGMAVLMVFPAYAGKMSFSAVTVQGASTAKAAVSSVANDPYGFVSVPEGFERLRNTPIVMDKGNSAKYRFEEYYHALPMEVQKIVLAARTPIYVGNREAMVGHIENLTEENIPGMSAGVTKFYIPEKGVDTRGKCQAFICVFPTFGKHAIKATEEKKIFDHEIGHLLSYYLYMEQGNTRPEDSEEFKAAVAADNGFTAGMGNRPNCSEKFAEAFALYLTDSEHVSAAFRHYYDGLLNAL